MRMMDIHVEIQQPLINLLRVQPHMFFSIVVSLGLFRKQTLQHIKKASNDSGLLGLYLFGI